MISGKYLTSELVSYACAREGHAPRVILLLPGGSLPGPPMSAKACFRSSLDNALRCSAVAHKRTRVHLQVACNEVAQ